VLVLFTVVLLRTAWVCDDAYITFRTADNFVHGHGLRWNTDERVQAFTHPLWLGVFVIPYSVTRDAFHTAIVLGLLLSVATAVLLPWRFAVSATTAVLALLLLVGSRAFVDYSTSGLENPLVHLLFLLFLLELRTPALESRSLFRLSLWAGLATLTRMDALLLFLPGLAWTVARSRRGSTLGRVAAGFVPFAVWELFALFYYGSPFPNTALAKLHTGVGHLDLLRCGVHYYRNSLLTDPLTLGAIFAALAVAAWRRTARDLCVAGGMILSLAYVLAIGGDFMSGRFFSTCFLAATVLLIWDRLPASRIATPVAFLAAIGLPLLGPSSNVFWGTRLDRKGRVFDDHGIADERRFYFPAAGLWNGAHAAGHPCGPAPDRGRRARADSEPLVVEGAIGYCGYFAGPRVHILDVHALADPLLARLPMVRHDPFFMGFARDLRLKNPPAWRVGHYLRRIPSGYLTTLISGQNRIADPDLAAYYDKLSLIVRGRLLSRARLAEIVRFNLRLDEHLIDAQKYRDYEKPDWSEVIAVRPDWAGGYRERGLSRLKSGEVDSALTDLETSVRLNPNDSPALVAVAQIVATRGDSTRALALLEHGVQADPADTEARVKLGQALVAKGRYDEAIATLQEAPECPWGLALVYNNIGSAYIKKREPGQAMVWLQKALAFGPMVSEIHYNLGCASMAVGDLPRARRSLETALALAPEFLQARKQLGMVLAQAGSDAAAIAQLEQYVAASPEDGEGLFALANLYARGGQTERAVPLWQRSARLGFARAQEQLRFRHDSW
jgi:arabinofuranosyltransferase